MPLHDIYCTERGKGCFYWPLLLTFMFLNVLTRVLPSWLCITADFWEYPLFCTFLYQRSCVVQMAKKPWHTLSITPRGWPPLATTSLGQAVCGCLAVWMVAHLLTHNFYLSALHHVEDLRKKESFSLLICNCVRPLGPQFGQNNACLVVEFLPWGHRN